MFAALLLKKENSALAIGSLKQLSTPPKHGAALDTTSAPVKALFLMSGMFLQVFILIINHIDLGYFS